MSSDFARQSDLDQTEHDRKLESMTRQEINLMAQRLAKLVRSKLVSETDSSEINTSASSSSKNEQTQDADAPLTASSKPLA
jgi:hypothetical protein